MHPIIESYLERWQDCAGVSETTLLRLALLRECIGQLQTQKSNCLARGLKTEIRAIQALEKQIQPLQELCVLPDNLSALFAGQVLGKRKKRTLPETFFQSIAREKWTRHDRTWECILAAEAIHLNWSFWSLETWVEIAALAEWNQTLNQKLWPHGLVLFTENAHSSVDSPPLSCETPLFWRGKWFMILHPQFYNPQDLSLNLVNWPGYPVEAPSASQWEHLYPTGNMP